MHIPSLVHLPTPPCRSSALLSLGSRTTTTTPTGTTVATESTTPTSAATERVRVQRCRRRHARVALRSEVGVVPDDTLRWIAVVDDSESLLIAASAATRCEAVGAAPTTLRAVGRPVGWPVTDR